MRTIWKFPLKFTGENGYACTVQMPRAAVVRHFAFEFRGPLDPGPRKGVPTIWAEVDSEQPAEPAQFQIFGTGHEIPNGATHVATFDSEPFVWHVFDMRRAVDIPENLRSVLPDFPAQNAYRLLIKAGFTLVIAPGGSKRYWQPPKSDEGLTTEEMEALGELQQHGFGSAA